MPPTFSRNAFFTAVILGYGAIATVVVGIPIIGYFLTPLIKPSPRRWVSVGPVDQFKVGQTVEVKFPDPTALQWSGQTNRQAGWLRRDGGDKFTAFSVYCTHLGCPIHWVPGSQLFLCPCHGSVFYSDGTVAAGPAAKRLVQYNVRVANGHVEIETRPIPVIG